MMVIWAVVNAMERPLPPDQQKVAHDVLLSLAAIHETMTDDQAIDLVSRLEDAGMDPSPPGMEILAEVLATAFA